MIEKEYLYIVLGMSLVTYLPRLIPVYYLSGRNLPGWLIEWLDLIPAAVLGALLLPELVTGGNPRNFTLGSLEMIVAVPTFLFAVKTKSLGGTAIVGMGLYWLLDIIFI
ncbi:MAG: AzlD domain-containing protein [Desulfobacteraceae bacterium]|nr:MAG: AzlD domain-containing protein [Desulfobacteraceae bacterium]